MKVHEDLLDKHLNLYKILNLPHEDRKIILDLYNQMHDALNGENGGIILPGGIKMDIVKATVIYNTLIEYNYIVTRREENLDKILG